MDAGECYVAKTREERASGQKLVVLLDQACLRLKTMSSGRARLMTSMDRRKEDDGADYRPDICHQCLMALLDSPINKAGKLCVYIRTQDSQLIEVHPQLTVPRTWRQFSALMVTLLLCHKVKSRENNTTLLRFVKNKPEILFPAGSRKIGLSVNGKRVNLREYTQQFKADKNPVVFVVGCVAKSDPASGNPHLEENVCISDFSLSAAVCCSKVCGELENVWSIV